MLCAARVAELLVESRVDRVFGIPGGPISPVCSAIVRSGIAFTLCQHEGMAVHLAAGYARMRERPSVVCATSGPGILNTATGVASSLLNEAPVIVLAGDAPSGTSLGPYVQDGSRSGLKIVEVFGPLAKAVLELTSADETDEIIGAAFGLAGSFPRGPVVIRIPVDVATSKMVGSKARSFVRRPDGDEIDAGSCARAAAMLAESSRPLIFLGVGAREARVSSEILALAERLTCPVAVEIEAKGLFPENHPLSLGVFGGGGHANEACAKYFATGVDVLLAVGARMNDFTSNNFSRLLAPTRSFIQVDHSRQRIRHSYEVDQEIVGDIGSALRLIVASLPKSIVRTGWSREDSPNLRSTSGMVPPFDPRAALAALQRNVPEDAIFVSDIGNHMLFAAETLNVSCPDGFFVQMGLGGMTSGLGAAIGMQIGCGAARQVVAICGDGGMLMGGNEVATCAAEGAPLLIVIFNDGRLGMVEHGDRVALGHPTAWRTPAVDFVGYARALGCDSDRLQSLDDLPRVLGARAPARPLVIEVRVDPDVFASNPRARLMGGVSRDGTKS
jgi:acetolactate synthase I/II/III large subunit